MQITTYQAQTTVTEIVTLQNARTPAECIERVLDGSATTTDCERFAAALGDKITKREQNALKYAYARARYRECRDLTIEQCALIAETTVERVHHHLRYLGIALRDHVTTDDATRVMMRIAD